MRDNLVSLEEDLLQYTKRFPPERGGILYRLVYKYSVQIFSDEKQLRDGMRSLGAAEEDILKVCLIARVTGFQDLIRPGKKLLQTDFDRFVCNAVKETELKRTAVLQLMAEITYAAGTAVLCRSRRQIERAVQAERAFAIPVSLYEEELQDFQRDFEMCRRWGDFTVLDLQRMEPLAAAGLPRAKYYLGYCLLHSTEAGREKGVALLEEAAGAGDTEAAAELGDYYFKCGPSRWSRAYSCYTGFGALALDEQRKDAVLTMLNQKRFNHRFLWLSAILLLLFAGTVILAPGARIYAPHYGLGGICAAGSLAILLLAVLRFRRSPFGNVYFVPAGMLVLWSIYIAVRLLPV